MDTAHLGRAFHGGQHYENFPVASWLIPARVRPAMLRLYRFARTADDLADEGDLSAQERLTGLGALERGLRGEMEPPAPYPEALLVEIGNGLRSALADHGGPIDEALALLTAFRADVHHQPMTDQQAVLHYCRYSAVPVGRLVLSLFGIVQTGHPCANDVKKDSDSICIGLQLANFAQDLGQDVRRGRIYFPSSWWPRDWSPEEGLAALSAEARADISNKMADWATDMLAAGRRLPGLIRTHPHGGLRLALEIALTIEGGLAIAAKVKRAPQLVWQRSPRLSRTDLMVLMFRALRLTYVS